MELLSVFPIYYTFLAVYVTCINIVTFIFFGVDKAKSRQIGARRIPEKTLWLLALVGGTVGAFLGMKFFRHKTKKIGFQIYLFLILFLQVASLFFLLDTYIA